MDTQKIHILEEYLYTLRSSSKEYKIIQSYIHTHYFTEAYSLTTPEIEDELKSSKSPIQILVFTNVLREREEAEEAILNLPSYCEMPEMCFLCEENPSISFQQCQTCLNSVQKQVHLLQIK